MGRAKLNRVVASTVIAGVLASGTVPFNVLAQGNQDQTVDQAKQVLMKLTDAQRKSLQEIDAKPAFVIAPSIDTKSPNLVNVIVEFNQAPAKVEVMKQAAKGLRMTSKTAAAKVEDAHSEFKQSFQALKNQRSASPQLKESKITREYRSAFTGVAMTIPGSEIENLVASGEVKRVWKDDVVKLELPTETKAASESKMMDSIPQIRVDKLHSEKITGKGIKVGVIDTGIDYNHPDLKYAYQGFRSSFGDPKAVEPDMVKGWDFVDNDADPMETTYKDWKASNQPEIDPTSGSAYYTEHGTHVSGTIAGEQKNSVDYAVEGVAPDVDLYGYRVLGAYGSGATSAVIAGIDKAVADGMDVINLSLGGGGNDPLDPTAIAINNAMLSGVVSVVAAGNNGPDEKTLHSPGTAALAITVGASDFAMNIPTLTKISAGSQTIENVKLLGKNFTDNLETLKGQSMQVMFAGLGKTTDFTGKDLTGKIALIQRGEVTFDEKVKNAAKAGAKAVIVYNNIDGEITSYLGEEMGLIPAFRLTKADGEKLKALGDNTSLTFGELTNVQTEGDSLASFSSRGPVGGTYDIKPDVVAPGVAIFSTIPEYINSPEEGVDYTTAYARLQGTSMATPHVAGVAALILQAHPGYTPFDVKSALMNTAVDLKGDNSVFEQGAGRIDAYNAVHTDISIKVMDTTENLENNAIVEIPNETGSISFGTHYKPVSGPIEDSRKMVIKNSGEEDKTFNVEVEYHGERTGIKDAVANGIKLDVPSTVAVASGKSVNIEPTITVPQGAAEGRYEGYIHVTNASNPDETYQVPFAIRITDRGIESFQPDRPAMANNTPNWQYMNPIINATFKLKSPIDTLDVILKDNKTGKVVGLVASINVKTAIPDNSYRVGNLFTGYVRPFTGDPNQPISNEWLQVPEGDFTFETIGTDAEGKTYTNESSILVDNTKPEVKFDKKPGVYEINDSMYTEENGKKAFWNHGNVTDSSINVLKSKGLNIDQSANTMYSSLTYNGLPYYGVIDWPPVAANGDVEYGIESTDIANGPFYVYFAASDIALNVNYKKYIYLKEGTEYLTSSYDKQEVKLGDTVTMTLSLNNVKNLVSGKYDVKYDSGLYTFKNVKLNNAIKKYAKQNRLDALVSDPAFKGSGVSSLVTVGATLSGSEFKGLNEDMPFLDITFKVTGDESYYGESDFKVTTSTYMKAGQSNAVTLPFYSTANFGFVSKHSKITGSILPEAFAKTITSGLILTSRDYTKIGAKIYAVSPSGKKYNGTIDSRGQFTILGVPASAQNFTVVVDIPGHLKTYKQVMTGVIRQGSYYGQSIGLAQMNLGLAGDVNGDDVVDIKDVQSVVDMYGTADSVILAQDINQDGVVNETDVRFIEKNFMEKSPEAKKEPQATVGKKGLDYYLNLIGLEPKH
ncbi:S8 family serine peptidase [Bacillus sp. AFS017336]|uniref:S8 family serine peptidase n=1 Tax=Bacillus sp. AFS017336 TaxID=2033489 RepID=UPI000BF1B931|nr:S8 family serine peptidase [Bacillus sp. AFS017336]PEL06033.1 peptidase S8 [Bacillus sp. AFS017336]